MTFILKITGFILFGFFLLIIISCNEETVDEMVSCNTTGQSSEINSRTFGMGFSTWSFGPRASDREETYSFISQHADIYSEQIDDKIPWSAWINDTALPEAFVSDIDARVASRLSNHELVLSVSLLNSARSDLLEDYDGSVPDYSSLDDQDIADAYFKHLDYLITRLEPNYLVMAMEVNELLINNPELWPAYKNLMAIIRLRVRNKYPDLLLSESVTLHNWYQSELSQVDSGEIRGYINSHLDFAAISFYPFFKGLKSKEQFQQAMSFLIDQVEVPVAFVETNHLAEDLIVESFNTNIPANECEQADYLDVLLWNASQQNYLFVVWWAHRDYDALWSTFPDEVKDLGKLWRDTGLLNESGQERPSFKIWNRVFSLD